MAEEVQSQALKSACQSFIQEQLQRDPFRSVAQIEGRLNSLQGRFRSIEQALNSDSGKVTALESIFDSSHINSSTGRPCERGSSSKSKAVSELDLLSGFNSQSLELHEFIEGRDYGELLDGIHKHLKNVILSESTNQERDQAALAALEKEVDALRRSSHSGLQQVSRTTITRPPASSHEAKEHSLHNEVQRTLRGAHGSGGKTNHFKPEAPFESLHDFFTGAYFQFCDLLATPTNREAEIGLLDVLKQGICNVQAAFVHRTGHPRTLGAVREALGGEGWVTSIRALGRRFLVWSRDVGVLQYPENQRFIAILVPAILVLFYSASPPLFGRPPATVSLQHPAPLGPLLSLDALEPPSMPTALASGSVTTLQDEYLEEDFWRSLLGE